MTETLERRLAELEAAALGVYAAHGLPTRAGHYQRAPKAKTWTFIGEDVPPQSRWDRVLEHPPETGWRFGALEALGARDARPEVQAASRTLGLCRDLRLRLAEGETGPAEDVLAVLDMADRLRPPQKQAAPKRPRTGSRKSAPARPGPRSDP